MRSKVMYVGHYITEIFSELDTTTLPYICAQSFPKTKTDRMVESFVRGLYIKQVCIHKHVEQFR